MTPSIPAVDPASGRVFAETPATDLADIPRLVAEARRAQSDWARRPLRERKKIIARFQAGLFEGRQEMAALISQENGKPVAEALLTDVAVTLDLARYYLKHAGRILRPRPVRTGNLAMLGRHGRVHWEPMGVLGIISPWNYPLLLPFGEIIAGLLAGNAALLKPSEFTTRSAVRGVGLLHEAGLPPALCQVIVGGGDAGRALVEAGPDKVFFTGSVATGRKVAQRAAELLIPVNLELGGSDAGIVLADADLERTASGVLWARFTNGGQTCVAVKRLIVERPAYEKMVALLVAGARELTLGPGMVPGNDVGPLIRESQVQELERQLAASVALGARVRTGGRRRPDVGPTFFEPTVVTDLPLDAPLWREEVFGPVLPVVPADDAEHALRIANDSSFGLSGSVWTADRVRGRDLARRLEVGSAMVNDATSHVGISEVPHGGQKFSGLGRTHGELGLLETCRPRYVGGDWLDWIRKPWWFGYHRDSLEARDAFLRFAFAPRWRDRITALPRALSLLRQQRRV